MSTTLSHSASTEPVEEVKTAHTITLVQRFPGCLVKIEMLVSPEATQAAYRKAVKNIGKEISLPGFRKGKAPDSLIVKHCGSQLKKEWHRLIVSTAFEEFLQASQLWPYMQAKSVKLMELKSHSLETGSHLVAEYETEPQVPTVDKSKIKIQPCPRPVITENDIDARIHQVQLHMGKRSAITDRPVQEGDFVEFDLLSLDSDPPNMLYVDRIHEITSKNLDNWMSKMLIGRNIDDTIEGICEPDEQSQAGGEFSFTRCRVRIKTISTYQLPTLDDDFAKSVGAEDMSVLRARAEEQLNFQADKEVLRQRCAQAEQQLTDLYKFDLPASLMEDLKNKAFKKRFESFRRINPQTPIEQLREEFEKSVIMEIDRSHRLWLLCSKVAEEHDIVVNPNEVIDEMRKYTSTNELWKLIGENDPLQTVLNLRNAVILRKTLDFLTS